MQYILTEETNVCIPKENLEDVLKALLPLSGASKVEDFDTLSTEVKIMSLLEWRDFVVEIQDDGLHILDESTCDFELSTNPVIAALLKYFKPGSHISSQETGEYYQLRCFEDHTEIVQATVIFPKDERFEFPMTMATEK